MRWIGRGIFGLLALILLCAALLSGFALSTHTCADCIQGRSLCPFALNLREGLQQFARVLAAIAGAFTLLILVQALMGPCVEKWNISSLVHLKARMNN